MNEAIALGCEACEFDSIPCSEGDQRQVRIKLQDVKGETDPYSLCSGSSGIVFCFFLANFTNFFFGCCSTALANALMNKLGLVRALRLLLY